VARGPHKLEYEIVERWEQLPEGWSFVDVAGVAVDSRDRVYVFSRGRYPVIVFDKDGRFLEAWGQGMFVRPHGIFITAQDQIFLVDDEGHAIYRCSTAGKVELKIGTGHPSDTGYVPGKFPVQRAAGPFNTVTSVAVLPTGEIYAADGYGNARVHKFSPKGELLLSWGEPGSGEGQFNLPHGIAVDSRGQVYVADRENSRVQIFSPHGHFLRAWTWVNRPNEIFIDEQDTIFIAETGFIFGNDPSPHLRLMRQPPPGHSPKARVSICNSDGEIQAQIGGEEYLLPGNFIAPHGLWVDSRGDLYVGEVVNAVSVSRRVPPVKPLVFQKFVRRGPR
jgi:hypothetical protein